MTKLEHILCKEIHREGAITFARFMDLALYCPKIGYYEQARPVIGRQGDYYTSVSTGSLFGELLARQFEAWLRPISPPPPRLVEAGAHDGRLAADILSWLSRNRPALFPDLEYWIIEPSAQRKGWQARQLEDFAARVRWFDHWRALPPEGVHGMIFANELLDAFPVHRLGWDAGNGRWFEWGVAFENGRFVWSRLAAVQDTWAQELERAGFELPPALLSVLPDGFVLELCPAAAAWWQDAACALRAGKLLTLDYGLTAQELLMPERSEGTLRAYFRHQHSRDVLARPGQQDLTAHLNFTMLQAVGEAAGLRTDGLFYQSQFLTRIAAPWLQSGGAETKDWTPARVREFQTLTHPEHLGRAFRVLVQSRQG